jgi:hypothetical protein
VVIVDDERHDEPVRSPKRSVAPAKRSAHDAARAKSKPRMAVKASRNGKPAKKKSSRASA